jgi:hypothetical protein
MILDAQTRLSNSQTPTQGTTTVSQNAYDTGEISPIRKIGSGEPLVACFFIEARTASADAFTFELIQADNDALTSNPQRLLIGRALTAADIPAGTIVEIPVPGSTPTKRYLGARYTLGANDALTVSAYLVPASFVPRFENYATNIVVL